MSATCPYCLREQHAGLLCSACCDRLERELSEVPAILTDLDVTLSKQARTEQGGSGSLARERNPIGDKAIDPRWVLGNVLGTWARDVSGERWQPRDGERVVYRSRSSAQAGPFCLDCRHRSCMNMRFVLQRPAEPLALQAALYLLSNVNPIRRHPAVEELVDEVIDAIGLARRTVDRLADRQYLGKCLAEFEGVTCTEEVWARPGAVSIACKVCGITHEVADRRAWLLKRAEDMLVTVREASRYVGEVGHITVTEASIRGYLHRGRIGYKTGTMIRLGDLLAVVVDEGERRTA